MDAPACEFCKIIFIASDSVFASLCGHLFHDSCLNIIFSGTAQYCPECFIRCDPSQSLRIYLPFQQETSIEQSLVTECKKMKHERTVVQKELLQAQATLIYFEKRAANATAVIKQKNDKLSEQKALTKEKETLQKKLKSLEKLHAVQKALTETSKDVHKIIEQKPPPDTLATMAVSLKREAERIKAEKKELRSEMREDRKENHVLLTNYRNSREKFEITSARRIQKGGKK